jgi:hypothetical protein
MSEPEKGPKPQDTRSANLAAAGLAGQIGCVVPMLILGSVLVGLWLDKVFNTGKTIILLFVLGSLPVTIYLTFRLAMRAVKEVNKTMPQPEPKNPADTKEDKTSE